MSRIKLHDILLGVAPGMSNGNTGGVVSGASAPCHARIIVTNEINIQKKQYTMILREIHPNERRFNPRKSATLKELIKLNTKI